MADSLYMLGGHLVFPGVYVDFPLSCQAAPSMGSSNGYSRAAINCGVTITSKIVHVNTVNNAITIYSVTDDALPPKVDHLRQHTRAAGHQLATGHVHAGYPLKPFERTEIAP